MRMHAIELPNNEVLIYLPDSLRVFKSNEYSKGLFSDICEGKTYENIKERGYELSPKEYQEYVRIFDENITTERPPKSNKLEELVIHISNDCNMGCLYCYGNGGNYHMEQCMMKKSVLLETLEKMYAIYPEIELINLFGGEPTLNPDLIEATSQYVKEHHKKTIVGMVTNGTNITDRIIELIKKYDLKVTFSVDIPELQNILRPMRNGAESYGRVLDNFKKLKEITGEPSGLEITYTEQHRIRGFSPVSVIEEIRDIFGDVPMVFNPVSSKEKNMKVNDLMIFADSLDELKGKDDLYFKIPYIGVISEKLKKGIVKYNFCKCGYGKHSVSANGDIYCCQAFLGREAFKFGNVNEPIDILRVKVLKRAEEFYQFNKLKEGKCANCYLNTICQRCMSDNELCQGSLYEADEDFCKMEKAVFDKVLIHNYGGIK